MKIRNGFVSNSSSSSYVIVLPDSFMLNTKDENIKKAFDVLRAQKNVNFLYSDCQEEIKESDRYDIYYNLKCILEKYIVAESHGGPDEGDQLILVSNDKIRKIWKEKE